MRTKAKLRITHSRPCIAADEIQAVSDSLAADDLSLGKTVNKFEASMADYVGVEHALAVNSGSSALQMALLALGIKKDDEVLLPTYGCPSLLNSVCSVGARPIFCDINQDDLNMDINEAERKISKRTKCIIFPYTYGNITPIDDFRGLGVPIIEDCCQALGADHNGQKLGSFGDISIFSFGSTKMITTGQGGMILSRHKKYYERIKTLLDYDFSPSYQRKGKQYQTRYNYTLTDFQAAMGIRQLAKVDRFIKCRKLIARRYTAEFTGVGLKVLPLYENGKTVYFRYLISADEKAVFEYARKLNRMKIMAVPGPNHLLHRYIDGYADKGFKNAVSQHKKLLSIPIYPALEAEQTEYIVRKVKSIIKGLE